MYTVTVVTVYKLRGADGIVTDETTVLTKVDSFLEKDLEDGIAKMHRNVLVPHPNCELFSVCHTVTR